MLELGHSNIDIQDPFTLPYGVYKLARETQTPEAIRQNHIGLILPGDTNSQPGFAGYISVGEAAKGPYNNISLPSHFDYLSHGDVVRIDPNSKRIRVLYRRNTGSNALMLTERCNHYCVMCSQPPKDIDDSQITKDLVDAIPLFSSNSKELILSGGEPTLTGELFFDILKAIKSHLPRTAVHVLSNGRSSSKLEFAERVGSLQMPDIMFGVPLYSDDPDRHNFVVQAESAFDETVNGILNLKASGVRVEIRVVLHSYTIPTLVSLASYIATNLTFVDHVAFMGLEAMGFAKSNWNDLWIDPRSYQSELLEACRIVSKKGIRTSVYNLPLCWIDPNILPYYVSSISDWKNDYPESCNSCAAAAKCGGFFSSNKAKLDLDTTLKPFTLDSFREWTKKC